MSASYLTLKVNNTVATPVNLKGGTVYITIYGDDVKLAAMPVDALAAPDDGVQQFYLPSSTEPGSPLARDGPQIYKFKGLGDRIYMAAVNAIATVSIMEV